jgi:septum site-determining protein MinD
LEPLSLGRSDPCEGLLISAIRETTTHEKARPKHNKSKPIPRWGRLLLWHPARAESAKLPRQRSGRCTGWDGQNVVVVDFDVGLRNLDLIMGAERRVVYDLINVIKGDAKLTQALIRDKRLDTLALLPASQSCEKDSLTQDGVARVINELRAKFDWVICDSPAGIEKGATLAMRHADIALVVVNPEVSSIRDADRIVGMLDSKTEKAERASASKSTFSSPV